MADNIMGHTIDIDIQRDLVLILRQRLIQIGYDQREVNGISDDLGLICAYQNACRRLVSAVSRKAIKSSGFSCPSEHASGLAAIELKIKSGVTLTPHLSKKVTNISYDDLLLNDWGIHHLHLGVAADSDGFVKRTGPLLYCFFDDQKAYLIDVLGHDDFTSQVVIQQVHDNWPRILAEFRAQGVKGDRLTDENIKALRSKHINYCLEMKDGTAYFPPGGGITTSGCNMTDRINAADLLDWARHEQDEVMSSMPGVIERARQDGRSFGSRIELRLCMPDGAYWLDDVHSGYRHPLPSP